ncbi:IPT/TIG domain-containing protein [Candidatus Curtissbacteria bacterium]|nr:IPT/TIG domain-containing protein [Candidatus Curtissbacteria bacterium]
MTKTVGIGKHKVKVQTVDTVSNSIDFEIIAEQPIINSISTTKDGADTYIKLSGTEFGSITSKVDLYSNDGTLAGTCGSEQTGYFWWNENEIYCKVPSSVKTNEQYNVQVVTRDGRQSPLKSYFLN